jgi:PAS domain S-box-containing protein
VIIHSGCEPWRSSNLNSETHKLAEDRPRQVPEVAFDPKAHLASLVDSSDDAIIGKDLNGIIVSWNNSATRIFGYAANEAIGRSILMIVPPELRNEEDQTLSKLRTGGGIDHYETVRMRKSGEKFPVSVTISPIRDVTGKVVGASKIARDISDRAKNDQSRFQLAAIVDSADDAIVSKDLNGIVRTWNQGAARMFGYTSEEMVGQPILRLIPKELYYEEDEILRKLRAGNRVDHYETIRMKKSGERVEVSVTISPIRDGSGRVIGASKIARDISDRRRMERMLVQSEKLAATGRMAATIAHEINNPLESLINLIFLAKKNSPPGGKAHAQLLTAEQELERLAHIARQTLGYYRDTGLPIEVHLHELIENVLTVYRSKLLASEITVETRFNDIQKISVSRGELLQVFSNIITNAIDAMRGGGILQITTRKISGPNGEAIQTVIRDSGVGIRQDHLEKIFEPFFTTKGNMGTGIGLWIARQLTERRGGQISVASSTESGSSGTSVTIILPLAAPDRMPSSQSK